jgi:hypothetical protein
MGKCIGTQQSCFSEEELQPLEQLGREYGSKKAAMVAGLQALKARGQVSDAELLALIGRSCGGGDCGCLRGRPAPEFNSRASLAVLVLIRPYGGHRRGHDHP